MSEQRKDFIKKSELNANTIEHEIDALKDGHRNDFKRQYREFWNHAKRISELFKTMKPLVRDDRDRLWSKFNDICNEVKRNQKQERLEQQVYSKVKRNLIEERIKQAYFSADPSHDPVYLSEASRLLNEALEMMKSGPSESDTKLLKEDREILWGMWQEAKEKLRYARQEIREQERKKYEERQMRRNELIQRWTDLVSKNEGVIARLQEQIDRLEDEVSNARSDEYADRVRGWIEEKYQKIRDINETNRELEDKIESVKSKMNK